MAKFLVRIRETRVHHFTIDAATEEEAKDIADELDDMSTSESDQFDSCEIMDATEVEP